MSQRPGYNESGHLPPSPPPTWQEVKRCGRKLSHLCETVSSVSLLIAAALLLAMLVATLGAHPRWQLLPGICQCFVWFFGFGCLTLGVARPTTLGIGILGILVGLVGAFFPLICAELSHLIGFPARHPLVLVFDAGLPGLGKYLIVISVIHLIGANFYAIIHHRMLQASVVLKSSQRAGTARETSFIPQCWEMYSCPEAVKTRCPNFQDKINCWKRTRGCMCDHVLTAFLFQGQKGDSTEIYAQSSLPSGSAEDLSAFPQRLRAEHPRPWRERWRFCHACSIFLEHQEMKYRRLNWVFAPISLLLLAVFFPIYHVGYGTLAGALDRLSARLAASGSLPEGINGNGSLVHSPYEYVLLIVLAMLLMSYVVEYTDRCLVDWKW